MYKIICRDLTGEECAFVAEGETINEAKDRFYAHGAESLLHKEKYESATDEEAESFSKKLDEHLSTQQKP